MRDEIRVGEPQAGPGRRSSRTRQPRTSASSARHLPSPCRSRRHSRPERSSNDPRSPIRLIRSSTRFAGSSVSEGSKPPKEPLDRPPLASLVEMCAGIPGRIDRVAVKGAVSLHRHENGATEMKPLEVVRAVEVQLDATGRPSRHRSRNCGSGVPGGRSGSRRFALPAATGWCGPRPSPGRGSPFGPAGPSAPSEPTMRAWRGGWLVETRASLSHTTLAHSPGRDCRASGGQSDGP